MANNKLMTTVAPHLHEKGQTIERAMRDVLLALTPAVVIAIVVYGMNVVYIIAVSMITAGLSEVVMRRLLRRKVTLGDLSAMVTGLIFAFLLPPTTPLWVVAIGAFLAVGVAKELFGGLGKNVFNPALLARVALMISPLALYTTKFVEPFYWRSVGFFTPVATSIDNSVVGRVVYKGLAGNNVDAVTSATPLSLLKSGRLLVDTVAGATPVGATWVTDAGRPSFWSTFLGFKSGCIGEVCILALLIGAAYLLYRRTIDWRIPAGIIGAFLAVMLVTWNHPIYQLFGGGLFLGAFFMATDWVTSPMTRRGKWIYAVGIGVSIALIRLLGPLPEGVAIAILQWNVLTLLIDRYIAEPKFGEVKKPWFNRLPVFQKRKSAEGET
ncbi:MAG: RnfABCDGE type electron transport complex subunit D [Actinobacteria bacterium]|nr:RnfABCDGE type electron transport complex subunit D [Actinomycetota bacterium]MCG2818129.1 RnfABCDGE type electron transport complex subunit D [Actinomycetes bacterium]MBU4178921.1 RnfABCDGE type electron transport complex subunit D [Actinomycetota bacterium]MBU4218918.1 RnfABCDGE type electron transport complex subunit D [Actinomycetota bacterium]MBU4359665.1 RnfABCDGE type electron transport complex subunit D [Actinomycetota bacterium]